MLHYKISDLKIISTQNNIGSQDLIILTNNNMLFQINKDLLSTRRVSKQEQQLALKNIKRKNTKKIKLENFFKSQTLKEYKFSIDKREMKEININPLPKNLNKINISETEMESVNNLVLLNNEGSFVFKF
jgi:hypothetical protein